MGGAALSCFAFISELTLILTSGDKKGKKVLMPFPWRRTFGGGKSLRCAICKEERSRRFVLDLSLNALGG